MRDAIMKIPKKIQKIIDKKAQLAMELIAVSNELDTWLIKHGADLTDSDLADSTLTGCMIYCEHGNAKTNIEEYIRNRM